MSGKKEGCGCSPLSRLDMSDEEETVSSTDTEIVMDVTTIEMTDQLLFVRKNCKETRVYKASLNDLSSSAALFLLSKAVQEMPKNDPQDGQSLWNNNGCICIASDPVANAFL